MVRDATTGRRGSARARRREARSDAIVEAALAILEAEGVDALSMQRLAGDLGYAVGALYRYFPSKDSLWASMQVRAVGALADEVDEVLEESARAPAIRGVPAEGSRALQAIVRVGWVFVTLESRRPTHAILIRASLADPRRLVESTHAEPVAEALTTLLACVAERIQVATATGALREGDPHLRTIAMWAALTGATAMRKLERFAPPRLDVDSVAREVLTGLLQGWGAPPGVVARIFERVQEAARGVAEERRP